MKILVTGAAGFIGYHTSKNLVERGHTIIGLDNLNDYYDINLKISRLKELGIDFQQESNKICLSKTLANFGFIKMDITNGDELHKLFELEKFDIVCHLAAQAGVRYSLEKPKAYIDSNINGFFNILDCCNKHSIKHLVYASSSSVYGMNDKVPFSVTDNVDHPISLYAATKKSNELMAHTYSHLYDIPTTGLRFFTVYGPWGRPDMAMFLFTKAIIDEKPIKVFNHGYMERDFTYIDDIVKGIVHVIEKGGAKKTPAGKPFKIYNIGNNKSVKLMHFIEAIENELGIIAKKELLPMQDGDVPKTWADVNGLIEDFDYQPDTPIEEGVASFIKWYKSYYN